MQAAEELLYQNVPWRNVQRIIQQRRRQKSISKAKDGALNAFPTFESKRVIKESLLEEF